MQVHRKRAARQIRTAPTLTLLQAATTLGDPQISGALLSRQAAVDRAKHHVEAACAELAAASHENTGATSVDAIAALAAIVTVLCTSDRSFAPGEAAFIVGRTESTVIAWSRRFGVGAKVRGRWVDDPLRLALLLLGGET